MFLFTNVQTIPEHEDHVLVWSTCDLGSDDMGFVRQAIEDCQYHAFEDERPERLFVFCAMRVRVMNPKCGPGAAPIVEFVLMADDDEELWAVYTKNGMEAIASYFDADPTPGRRGVFSMRFDYKTVNAELTVKVS